MRKQTRFRLIGVTDENVGCACCGRVDLKRYAVIEDTDNLEISFYGSTCATKILGSKVGTAAKVSAKKVLETKSEKFEVIISDRIKLEIEAIRNYSQGYLSLFVTSHTDSGAWILPDLNSIKLRMKNWVASGADNVGKLASLVKEADEQFN